MRFCNVLEKLRWHAALMAAIAIMSFALPASGAPTKSNEPVGADFGLPQVKFINEQIRAGWKENGLTPSVVATDPEWCRRVYLDILGRIPSVEELIEFVLS